MSDDLNFLPEGAVLIGDGGQQIDLGQSVQSAVYNGPVDGAAALTIDVFDPDRILLKSGILEKRATLTIDEHSFELVKPRKRGDTFTLVFEDLLVAEMRRHNEPRKFAAGTVTRVEAARALLEEIPWARLAVANNNSERVKVELARGTLTAVTTDTTSAAAAGPQADFFSNPDGRVAASTREKSTEITDENREDTWECLKRWFAEINWRCYVDKGVVNVGPDSAYVNGDPVYNFTEFTEGIGFVDWEWDVGQPMADANLVVQVQRWALSPGSCVQILEQGPATGKWMVSEIERDLYKPESEIKLRFPEPELPEPDPPPEPDTSAIDGGAFSGSALTSGSGEVTSSPGNSSSSGFWGWPLQGENRITSTFSKSRVNPVIGQNKPHQGIDIAAKLNQAVIASHDGVVSFAGQQSGHGNVVYIKHRGANLVGLWPYETRYGHLNRILVRNGMPVKRGDIIGGAGQAGTATGVHSHFEIRKNGTAVNPTPLLVGGAE